ncbi:hypothetical protein M1B35_00420 [Pseudomonas sp. MAFF 302046]|uniref:Uncharacterized protein n=1 Tax=Pseudomonas morbosilactucae TaxID=2938197 RepID=A0ABT0J9T2_9PSED|nr:hypothetical protein [Pseudomonas morbosilactucae]MCK9812647.1 hypothetical protein [Pseudomonas morbosilactucae]
MEKNFFLASNVSIQRGDQQYDLHNYFDLSGIAVDFFERSVILTLKSIESACADSLFKRLVITFLEVDYLDVSPGTLKGMVFEVAELGYKPADDFDHDWLVMESKSTKEDHFFYSVGR